jgi:hypothetical protein
MRQRPVRVFTPEHSQFPPVLARDHHQGILPGSQPDQALSIPRNNDPASLHGHRFEISFAVTTKKQAIQRIIASVRYFIAVIVSCQENIRDLIIGKITCKNRENRSKLSFFR